jgi:hypothetical protein
MRQRGHDPFTAGPLAPEEAEHYRNQQVHQDYLRSSVLA